ncbi:MAG: tRNA (adenosine(37)-N6)-threonylcarbamoyltransferase complex dimerization subunit type 1 TsaB [Candidatus Gastranaerophilales bacterium]|nr:tRNA (adenosine(37)-N6)-threonylcarbamoyltransferase complex dimerization subunit type 1 TsaB [Candidatus Gastranaerophilales bacterium]
MLILAFDTCLDKMYVSLADGENILTSKIVETTKEHYHSAFLISTTRDILKEKNLMPQDIEVIATNIGPGSFTGIRACTTVARVIAQAAEIKTIGVSSLEILSWVKGKEVKSKMQKVKGEMENLLLTSHLSPLTLVALDARKEMAYMAMFENGKEIIAPKTIPLEELKKNIKEWQPFIITDDKLLPVLGGISYQNQDDNLGEYLIKIAYEKLKSGCETDWRKLHPLYIQPPPVTIKGKQ